MKLSYRIALITVVVCFVIALLFTAGQLDMLFLAVLGAVFTISSALVVFIGVLSHGPEYRKGFFLTAGILLLLGVGICGPMLISAMV